MTFMLHKNLLEVNGRSKEELRVKKSRTVQSKHKAACVFLAEPAFREI